MIHVTKTCDYNIGSAHGSKQPRRPAKFCEASVEIFNCGPLLLRPNVSPEISRCDISNKRGGISPPSPLFAARMLRLFRCWLTALLLFEPHRRVTITCWNAPLWPLWPLELSVAPECLRVAPSRKITRRAFMKQGLLQRCLTPSPRSVILREREPSAARRARTKDLCIFSERGPVNSKLLCLPLHL